MIRAARYRREQGPFWWAWAFLVAVFVIAGLDAISHPLAVAVVTAVIVWWIAARFYRAWVRYRP